MSVHFRILTCTTIAVLSVLLTPCVNADIMGFTDIYAPANWTKVEDTGFIDDTTDVPNSITLTSGNDGSGTPSLTTYSILLTYSGALSFHWSYFTDDVDGSTYDPFGYFLLTPPFTTPPSSLDLVRLSPDNVFNPPPDPPQTGDVMSLAVTAGQTFGFYTSSDNRKGSATTTITLFSAPGPAGGGPTVPEPATASLLGIAVLTGAFWQFFKRRRPAIAR